SYDAAVARGNNIITLSEEQAAEWEAAAEATTDAWTADMDEKGLDGTGLRKRAAELIVKHSGN
ncbi:MAG: C4-dicarboxylate ABC transporter, partial [Rhodobacteraceae bacterium]|nr:C4-dicarboxylate ABC transporter [Paracoccaceae bacterium]